MEDPPRGQPEDRQVKEPGRASASRPSEAGTLRMSSGGRGSEWRSGKPQIDLVPPSPDQTHQRVEAWKAMEK